MKIGVFRWLMSASVLVLAASTASATSIYPNLVVNGNFNATSANGDVYQWQDSSPLASPWTFSETGAGIASNGSALGFTNAPDGAGQAAFLQIYHGDQTSLDSAQASISQTISDISAGSWYTLSFDLEGTAPVTATVDGITMKETPASGEWSSYTSEVFQAKSSTATLTFAAIPQDMAASANYNLSTAISNVSLVDPPHQNVPEGGSALSFLLLAAITSLVALRMQRTATAV